MGVLLARQNVEEALEVVKNAREGSYRIMIEKTHGALLFQDHGILKLMLEILYRKIELHTKAMTLF